MLPKFLFLSVALAVASNMTAKRVQHFPMEADKYGELTEEVTGRYLQVYGRHINENVPGAVGSALRFDGYSTYAQGSVNGLGDCSKLTVSIWVAPETYPIVKLDTPTDEKIRIAGTLDEDNKKGWSFNLGYTGNYTFKTFSGGWPLEIVAEDKIPCYEWSHLVAVFDGEERKISLYRNGVLVGSGKTMEVMNADGSSMSVGKVPGAVKGDFSIETFNGLIDDIEIFDEVLSKEAIAAYTPENVADLTIPVSRFDDDLFRPAFHGMPGAGWTNESHGLTYFNGRYHLFFQKNANGPFMTRLHWGHISSENLFDWREERIAIAPAESYDVKGCWSGCVFTDDEITGGKPNIIYTGVDYQKAIIAQATPNDDDLISWEKTPDNPIINGRPMGLSDDFRDPYFFRNGDDAYIVVGSSKDNIGVATLHKYDITSGSWSNDGKVFFKGSSAASDGRFWEMPTVTHMENGKWLVTVTPLETASGVHTIYWTGTINADGTFSPDEASSSPRDFELISKDGFGLLSPTIYQKDGTTLALGIVPDKVATSENCKWGWAHLYSFPREISLDASGNLLQKPFEGLKALRSEKNAIISDAVISGVQPLEGVSGRHIELLGHFKVGLSEFGFSFFKNATGEATVSYNPTTNELKADFSSLHRLVNDDNVYNGVYRTKLPEEIESGSDFKLNVFIDGSVLDIFVNDKWATSIRVYPMDADADRVEVFSQGGDTQASRISAWVLSQSGGASIGSIWNDSSFCGDYPISVYTITGQKIKEANSEEEAVIGLKKGIYIVGAKKVFIN